MRYILIVSLALVCCACQTTPRNDFAGSTLLITVTDDTSQIIPQRGFHPGTYPNSTEARNRLLELEQDYPLRQIDGWPIRLLGVYCAVMALSGGADQVSTLAALQNDPRVKVAQPMHTFAVQASYNDPYFDLQYQQHADKIAALHRVTTGRDVRIALIDTGVDRHHPELRGHLQITQNFVADDSRFDSDIHGTALAGIIASAADNGLGIVGLAPDAQLLALKACWQLVEGAIAANCNSFTLAKALSFAIEQQSDIVNFSLAGPHDPLLSQLLKLALERNIVIVAAASRAGDFPASEPGVISVSNDLNNAVGTTLILQAKELLSTSPGGGYDFFQGASLTTAQVSASVALLKQQHPEPWTSIKLRSLLQQLLGQELAYAPHD